MNLKPLTAHILSLRHEPGERCRACETAIEKQLETLTQNDAPLTFVLPAFPAKSANRDKTLSPLPDLGEKLAIARLEKLCADIRQIYSPGARMLICSDGRVFNDLVQVSEQQVQSYNQNLQAYTQLQGFKHIEFFDLKDVYPNLSTEAAREQLMRYYATPLDRIQSAVRNDLMMKALFNGLHRFMLEDLIYLHPELSKNAVRKQSKAITYHMMQRSQAWSALLSEKFPNVFRLSIHGYDCGSEKFGIKLLPNQVGWATPWHNVILKQGQRLRFVKHQIAKALKAHLVWDGGIPSHYELNEV